MSDNWNEGIDRAIREMEQRARAVFLGTAAHLERSIKDGSSLTGAPGQPVQTGNLKRSWQTTFPSQDVAEIATNVIYAPGIEDGVSLKTGKALTLRSPEGGFHSVKLTVAGFEKIVTAEVVAAGGEAGGTA